MKPRFFATPAAFRAWLEKNHDRVDVLEVGYYKRDSGKPSITWPESVDVALCFGWIDGVRHARDHESYTVRFTPRRRGSRWSAVNTRRARALHEAGAMHPAGVRAFEQRDDAAADASYEERLSAALDADAERALREHAQAWAFYAAQAPYYRRLTAFWINSAKKPETRAQRLAALVADSANGMLVKPFRRKAYDAAVPVTSTTPTRSTTRRHRSGETRADRG